MTADQQSIKKIGNNQQILRMAVRFNDKTNATRKRSSLRGINSDLKGLNVNYHTAQAAPCQTEVFEEADDLMDA